MNNKCIIKNKSIILENEYYQKKVSKDLRSLFDYLEKRNFDNFPKIIDIDERSVKTEYIKEDDFLKKDKPNTLMQLVSALHYKTSDYKSVSKNKYKEIYEKINDNIDYLMNYYNNMITKIERTIYYSPSEYLVARNFSIILYSLNYSKRTLDDWYDLVENKTKERVVIVHNNLKTEHVLRSEKDYLINWDKYLVDTPVLDIYKFYINEGVTLDFVELYKIYNKTFKLTNEEKKLLFLLISLPKKITFLENEYLSTYNTKKIIDSLYKTKEIINNLEFEIDETKEEN